MRVKDVFVVQVKGNYGKANSTHKSRHRQPSHGLGGNPELTPS
jgi:hypothetical protein